MIRSHPEVTPPSDPEISIWRYMDLARLISLLSERVLWFARADLLGDDHEGALGSRTVEERRRVYSDQLRGANWDLDGLAMQGLDVEMVIESGLLNWENLFAASRRITYVNCWHMNDQESMAMWNVYAARGEGVAIRSTYRRLCDSLAGAPEDVNAGVVEYVDLSVDSLDPFPNFITPFLRKRKAFEYEQEVRAITLQEPPGERVNDFVTRSEMPTRNGGEWSTDPGLSLPVDIERLIEAVYVCPGRPAWFHRSVTALVRCLGGEGVEVRASSLDTDPVY